MHDLHSVIGMAISWDLRADPSGLLTWVHDFARPLATIDDLEPLLDMIGEARYVLIGEASHGTSEFYTWRAELSKRLIQERGFSFVGVEGDWPDCYRVNRYAKGVADSGENAESVLHAFERWPTWMWANREVGQFVEWLREYNDHLPLDHRVGFYGLDVYSLWESMAAVIDYLQGRDPALATAARRAYGCFDPYYEDAQEYARATAFVPMSCEADVLAVLKAIRSRATTYREDDGRDAYFDAEQNALVARNAEQYYRTMLRGGSASWNVRDRHMVETLNRLMTHHGDGAKAIIWEHNTHVGDARFTDMAGHGMLNVGQLVRQSHGGGPSDRDGVALIGFGTHRGSVIAASEWGAPMRRMRVPHARSGSWEDLLHGARPENLLLLSRDADGLPDTGDVPVDHRAIGVVYEPRAERWGNYVPTLITQRYDAFLFLDETHGLDPLHLPVVIDREVLETYPSGM